MKPTLSRVVSITCLLLASILASTGCATSGGTRASLSASVRVGSHAPGTVVAVLPVGYRVVRVGGVSYRYHRGVFYRPHGRKFVVVRAPAGIRVAALRD